MNTTRHEGRNIKRLREMKGIKQGAMAIELNITQQRLSDIEQTEKIDDGLMQQIAKILDLSPEVIKNFDEGAAFNVLSNTFTSSENSTLNAVNLFCTINPVDKWIEALRKNEELYERLLQTEREKITLLEKLVNQQNA